MSSTRLLPLLLAAAALGAGASPAAAAVFTPRVVEPAAPSLVRSSNGSALYSVAAEGYERAFLVADLRGAATYYDWGYAYGRLLAAESVENFGALFNSTVGPSPLLQAVLSLFLDAQFERYLEPLLPAQYADELRGLSDAGRDAGHPELGLLVARGVTLGNIATGDVKDDVEYLLRHELGLGPGRSRVARLAPPGTTAAALAARFAAAARGLFARHCSMWGAWGARTAGGGLWSGRNLDWNPQTGVARHKVVAVYHPPSGAPAGSAPYATVGFAGLVGALTGMSARGLTVHEAGNDNKRETLQGFAWMLRLRDLMEHATSLDDARARWAAANNTVGLNHGVGFGGAGGEGPGGARFMALETCAGRTAYFYDNDARERASPYGAPLPEAVFRTNHGYDPAVLRTATYNSTHLPGSDTEVRYMLLHDTLSQYEGTPLSPLQAVNLTAVDGDKGPRYTRTAAPFLDCSRAHAAKGINVLSVTYDATPATATMYVAVEEGAGAAYVPAACNAYVRFDMQRWFARA